MKKVLTLIVLLGVVLQVIGCKGAGEYEAPSNPPKNTPKNAGD